MIGALASEAKERDTRGASGNDRQGNGASRFFAFLQTLFMRRDGGTLEKAAEMAFGIDLTKVTAPAMIAVQRAAAFLAMGFRAVNLPPPTELNVDQHSMVTFFSSPLPSQLAHDVVSQFRIWLIGAALRELDAGYSLYLDGVFRAAT